MLNHWPATLCLGHARCKRQAENVSGLLAATRGFTQPRSSLPGHVNTASSLKHGGYTMSRLAGGRRSGKCKGAAAQVGLCRRRLSNPPVGGLPAVWICVSTLAGRQLGGQAPARCPQPDAAPRVAAVAFPVLFTLPSPSLSGPTARRRAVSSASRAAGERIESGTRAPGLEGCSRRSAPPSSSAADR